MKNIFKKILTTLSCLALVLCVGLSLTACGKKEDPQDPPPPPPTVTSVATLEQLKDALKTDNSIQLTGNIELTNETLTIDKKITLDLNGHSITGTITDENRRDLIKVVGGELTVNDANNQGSITLNGKKENLNNGYVFNVGTHNKTENTSVAGKLVINGGKFTTKNDVTVVQLVYGETTINGGIFQVSYDTGNGNEKDGKTLMINRFNKNKYNEAVDYYESVKLVINGGKFEGFNPQGDRANIEDETNVDKNYLAEGKTVDSTTEDGWYIVK